MEVLVFFPAKPPGRQTRIISRRPPDNVRTRQLSASCPADKSGQVCSFARQVGQLQIMLAGCGSYAFGSTDKSGQKELFARQVRLNRAVHQTSFSSGRQPPVVRRTSSVVFRSRFPCFKTWRGFVSGHPEVLDDMETEATTSPCGWQPDTVPTWVVPWGQVPVSSRDRIGSPP